MKPASLALLLCLTAVPATAQIALFEFNNQSLASTDTDPRSVVSDITTPLPVMFAPGNLCFGVHWHSPVPAGPFNNSPAYLEFSVTSSLPQTFTSMKFRTWRGGGALDYIEYGAIYADEDPGPGGDNFTTQVATADLYPQSSGGDWVVMDLVGTPFLTNVSGVITFRIYLWGDPNSCCSNAEFKTLKLYGDCSGTSAAVIPLGPSCGLPLDPVLEADLPVLGESGSVFMHSAFPNAVVFPFMSLGPVAPVTIATSPPCTIYVDILNPLTNLVWLPVGTTDANGYWEFPWTLPADATLLGLEAVFQARVCAPNGPTGPLFPDWSSTGLMLRLGCP